MTRGSRFKQGAPRRVRWTAAEARGVLSAFETSGMSQAEFCRRRRLDRQRLIRWRHRLGMSSATRPPSLQPVALIEDEPGMGREGFELELPRGWRVRIPAGFDEPSLARLLGLLEARS